MKRYFLKTKILLLASLILSGCRQNSYEATDGIAVIDVVNNLGKYHEVPVSKFVTELEYVPLQTTDDCLIGDVRYVFATLTHIFVASSNYYFALDRSGWFIGKIGSIGQGPGEYQGVTGLSVDIKKQSLYISTRTLLEYSWDGIF
jgi:hypothetical protein